MKFYRLSKFYWVVLICLLSFVASTGIVEAKGPAYVKKDTYVYRYDTTRAKKTIEGGTRVQVVSDIEKGWCLIIDTRGVKWSINANDLMTVKAWENTNQAPSQVIAAPPSSPMVASNQGADKVNVIRLNDAGLDTTRTIQLDASVACSQFTDDGKYISSITVKGVLTVAQVDTGQTVRVVSFADKKSNLASCISGNGRMAFIENGRFISVIELPSGKKIRTLQCPEKDYSCPNIIHALSASYDGRTLAALCDPKMSFLHFYQVDTAKLVASYQSDKYLKNEIYLSPDGQYACAVQDLQSLKIIDAKRGSLLTAIEHDYHRIRVDFSRDSRYLLSASGAKVAVLFDLPQQKLVKVIKDDKAIDQAKFAVDGKTFFTWNDSSGLSIHQVDSDGFNRLALKGKVDFVNKGQYVLAVSSKKMEIIDVSSGKTLVSKDIDGNSASKVVAKSFDCNTLAVMSSRNKILLFDCLKLIEQAAKGQ